ncbi:MAG: HlyD family efflux transporter periplasmic adaptor subunit [Syntrophobacterales bacterium]|jgi:RND family efflux transporter MFP subunit
MRPVFLKGLEMKTTTLRKVIVFAFAFIALLQSLEAASSEIVPPSAPGDVVVAKPAMRWVTLTGYTRARYVMDIVSEESGRCVKVTADVGDQIGKDGLFALLDTTFIDLTLKKNRVDQQRLTNMIAFHAKEVGRFEKLVERETAAQSRLDEIQNKLDQAEFQIKTLKVQESELKERRSRHYIRIPQGWSIIQRDVEPGEWVSVGKHLGKAGDFRTLLVPFALSPEEYRALKKTKGSIELSLSSEGQNTTSLRASVARVSPAFDPETRKINVELAVTETLSENRGGLRAELTLEMPDPSGAVLIPASAVAERYEEFWLTRANGEKIRVLFLGDGPDNTYRVRASDLKPGDKFRLKP